MAMSLVSATSLALSATAGANVVVRTNNANNVKPSARTVGGKRPYLARRPRVGLNGTELVLLGGGATLPAIAYVGVAAATGTGMQPAGSLTGDGAANPVSAGSVLGYFDATAPLPLAGPTGLTWLTTYAQTGSGFGKAIMNGSDPQPLPAPQLGATATAGVNGFNGDEVSGSPANTGNESQTDTADFAGSDAPLKQSEYTALAAHYPGRGEFVQIPYVGGGVAIAFNNPDIVDTVSLTSAEIDSMAKGVITNWNAIPAASDVVGWAAGAYNSSVCGGSVCTTKYPHASPFSAVSATTNPGFPLRALYWTYRFDNSGTTFSFTNYLSGKDSAWGLTQTFVDALPSGGTTTGFCGANGNPGVLDAIDANPGSAGYAEAANALAAATTHPNTKRAKVYLYNIAGYDKDPIKDTPAAAKTVASFTTDKVAVYQSGSGSVGGVSIGINGAPPAGGTYACKATTTDSPSSVTGRPSPDLVAATGIYQPGALGIVDPTAYKSPYAGYPILAVSYLEFYSSGNGIYAPALRYLAQEVSNPSSYGAGGITTIDPNTTAAGAGTTGFGQLGILNLFYTNAYIGIDRFIQ
jgi:phosphate transport system substrate-binding protein